jgi:hypothetical protein
MASEPGRTLGLAAGDSSTNLAPAPTTSTPTEKLFTEPAEIPYLPDELVETIAGQISPVDLACFRAVNRQTRCVIGVDSRGFIPGNRIYQHIIEGKRFAQAGNLLVGEDVGKRLPPLEPRPGVNICLAQYTPCIGWAIMCRFERDIDVAKADMLVCWTHRTKHPRSSFLPSDPTILDFCKPSSRPELRLCCEAAAKRLFSPMRSAPHEHYIGGTVSREPFKSHANEVCIVEEWMKFTSIASFSCASIVIIRFLGRMTLWKLWMSTLVIYAHLQSPCQGAGTASQTPFLREGAEKLSCKTKKGSKSTLQLRQKSRLLGVVPTN